MVEWVDASTYPSDCLSGVLESAVPDLAQTVGWLVHHDDKFTVLKQHNAGESNDDFFKIPTRLIHRILYFKHDKEEVTHHWKGVL